MTELEQLQIKSKKQLSQVVITDLGDQEPYTTYLHLNLPILNSIQTLSLALHDIYKCCDPLLWTVSHLQTNSLIKYIFLMMIKRMLRSSEPRFSYSSASTSGSMDQRSPKISFADKALMSGFQLIKLLVNLHSHTHH